MKCKLISLFLFSCLFITILNVSAQEIPIKTIYEHVIVKTDSSFTKEVTVTLKKNDDIVVYPIVYDTELEELSEVQVYLKKGKRYKLTKNPVIKEEGVDLDYVTSKKIKSVVILPDSEAKITYLLTCKELMYFSGFYFFSYNQVDTLKYKIEMPESFQMVHNTIYRDSLDYLQLDSSKINGWRSLRLEVVPKKVKANPLMFFGIYKNLKVPMMRSLIVPESYHNRAKDYMNDWYMQKVEERRGLDSTVICKIDKITEGLNDPMDILNVLYGYVKANFKYVAIEVGMGAFIPTHANEVFHNKQGDCKDLSNFLSEALNYKGIKCDIAMAATFSHISDCNFPSLCSANHVICVAYVNNKLIVLDPTDPIHVPETPVQSIQDRSVLIVNSNGGEFYEPVGFSPKENCIDYDIELKANSDQMFMEGNFKVNYDGISGNFLRRVFMDVGINEMNSIGKNHYESVFGNQSVSDVNIIKNEKKIGANGKLNVKGKVFKDEKTTLLFVDFLPRIIETEEREILLEGTHLGNTIGKNVILKITMDEAFECFKPIQHTFTNDGVSLNISIRNPSDFVIECKYEFELDYIFIGKENVDITNKILKSFKKISNEPIILKRKS